MPMKHDIITVALAAEEKGCTRQGIYQSLDRGVLTEYRLGSTRLVVMDAKYAAYQVKRVGGRAHRAYVEKREK